MIYLPEKTTKTYKKLSNAEMLELCPILLNSISSN